MPIQLLAEFDPCPTLHGDVVELCGPRLMDSARILTEEGGDVTITFNEWRDMLVVAGRLADSELPLTGLCIQADGFTIIQFSFE